MAEDPRFAANPGRLRNRTALAAALAPPIGGRRRDESLAAFAAAGIPGGPINDVAQVFADPQVIARGLRFERGGLPAIASPIVIDGRRQIAERACPPLSDKPSGESTS